MNDKDILMLTELVNRLARAETEELAEVIESSMESFGAGDVSELKAALYRLSERIMKSDDEHRDALRSRRLAALTDKEREELNTVERIIDGNLLTYHFQPIISAMDGEIFGYEALMRSADDPRITPFHILKYAGMTDRLGEIERATLLNVLSLIEQEKSRFGGKAVFINSIPNVRLDLEEMEPVLELLQRHNDAAVVEFTEIAEADEAQLSVLKDRYRSMNVRIAVDDFGAGYSNTTNLLRYMPDYVKIDRSLLSEINEDSKKRHLVRDIIEFCHDNGMMALAEGVETAQELKTVVLMGIDLIQGYYTARPAADIVDSIPYDIKQEIRHYSQQRIDGKETLVYKVEGSERVLLDKLVKKGYKCIRVMPSKEKGFIRVVGDPSLDTDIHIEVDSGFNGMLSLEDVHLSNERERPCIYLADGCNVEISVYGICRLNNGGVYVPEGSELEFTGAGKFLIDLTSPNFYGIGAPIDKRHGKLTFDANVEFNIDAHGQLGACIGSGLGGDIDIHKGVFVFKTHGCNGVGIGALTGDAELTLCNCGINANMNFVKGAVIGSCDGAAKLSMSAMSINGVLGGQTVVMLGSVEGDAEVLVENSNLMADARSDNLTVIGSLCADSDVVVKNVSADIDAGGAEAYVYGGYKGRTKLGLFNTDTQIKLISDHDYFTAAQGDDLRLGGGRYRVVVNSKNLDVVSNV